MRSMTPTFTEKARRAQIIECAIDTIAESGFAQASMRRIADRAGVAMSVVSYYFGRKDDLVAAIVAECYDKLIDVMLPAVEGESTALGKLSAHIRSHMSYIHTCRAHQMALTDIASNFRGRHGARITDIEIDSAHREALGEIDLAVIFRMGVTSGEFRSLSTESMTLAVRSAIGGAALQAATTPEFDPIAYGEDLIDVFRRAVVNNID